ncbi:hypothetical protein GRAN_4900 [Granulicella sibirica]|uniref:Uncharacterized protein n=1 Tax=Granulicella sibirica TaxID=2479048 RepID=A0A4Q0SXM9_9BACT|nr:hypothetical protein GRAN_4900 [Granulicella sibirica]
MAKGSCLNLLTVSCTAELEKDVIQGEWGAVEDGGTIAREIGSKCFRILLKDVFGATSGRTSGDNGWAALWQRSAGYCKAPEASANIVKPAFQHKMAAIHDANPVRDPFYFVQLVTGKEDRTTFTRTFFHKDTEQSVKDDGIKADRGFVKDQERRALSNSAYQCGLGLVSQREF